MMPYNKLNFHITNRCNYNCKYCFGKFKNDNLSLDDVKKIIDNINNYFIEENILDKWINFAGGEPLLYKHLDDAISYANSLGIKVSIITNGYLLTEEKIKSWKNKISCIGISVDSLDKDTDIKIGRCCGKNTLEKDKLIQLAKVIHNVGIDLKINTVVSKFNITEDFSKLYDELKPKKVKLLQMHIVNRINDQAKDYKITKDEFFNFSKKYENKSYKLVKEEEGSMENSYLMIDPSGYFTINNKGEYEKPKNCLQEPFSEIVKRSGINEQKFKSRYNDEVK